ncbi:MAG: DedA family protein [Alkalimonas sp.]|nr:DedA family protein [Alkalimonas sp.]
MAYLTLFVSAFTAATLLPGSSEILLLALQQQGYLPIWLWLFATAGNTLGSCVNWYLGKEVNRFQHKRWFPFTPEQMNKASVRFQRYGSWGLLLSWLPVVGDPFTLVAGVMRVRFPLFLLLVAVGKSLRYAVLLGLGMAIFQ